MEYINFRRIVLSAIETLTLTVGVHQTILLYGTPPALALNILFLTIPIVTAIATFFFISTAPLIVATLATATIAVFASVPTFFPHIITTFAIVTTIVTILIIAIVADKYQVKFLWTVLVFGIECIAICGAFIISVSVGPGAVVGLVGITLLGGLWFLTPYLHLTIPKKSSV